MHRGEPANKEADMQAGKAISNKDVPMEWQLWHDGTNQEVFTWQEPRRKESTVSCKDRKSTWSSGVRNVIRRGSAEVEMHKHQESVRDRATGAWPMLETNQQTKTTS